MTKLFVAILSVFLLSAISDPIGEANRKRRWRRFAWLVGIEATFCLSLRTILGSCNLPLRMTDVVAYAHFAAVMHVISLNVLNIAHLTAALVARAATAREAPSARRVLVRPSLEGPSTQGRSDIRSGSGST